MSKRGQITVFVIIGIIIVAAIALLGMLYSQGIILPLSQEESRQVLSSQVEPLRSYVAECITQSSIVGLNYLGEHAGYYDYERDGLGKIDYAGDKVVVVVNTQNGLVNRLPSEQGFEGQFKIYMERAGKNSVTSCFEGFEGFRDDGYDITLGPREITADLTQANVKVNVDWTITLRKGRARIPVEMRDIIIPMKARKTFLIANDIINLEASGVPFEGQEIDKYVAANPLTLKSIDFVFENYPSFNQKVFMLKSIPDNPLEEEFRFYFAVDRSIPV